jgi:hypothetical protein
MKFKVFMLAFNEKSVVREVDVPDYQLTGKPEQDLDRIWHYGQNEIQPRKVESISVGDVLEYYGKLYMAKRTFGFKEISREEFDQYSNLPDRIRGDAAIDAIDRYEWQKANGIHE